MPKFMFKFNYSSASWARMLVVTDDRTSAAAALLEYLGGKMESMHFVVEDAAGYVICDLPDSLSAAAVITTGIRTGAFKEIEVTQLLDQDQLREVVALARSAADIYHPPGAASVEKVI
jgi:uncharacterized protein with GYD domain